MSKFGHRMPAKQLAQSPYGKAFRELTEKAQAQAIALGHDFPSADEWDYDGSALGHYFGKCRRCGHSAIIRMDEKNEDNRLVGQVLKIACPGHSWL